MRIDVDDVILSKAAVIERSLNRMREEYCANPSLDNYTHLDAMTLNIERACQAGIDMAMHVVAEKHLGLPQSNAEAFRFLREAKFISEAVLRDMSAMTGFRNVAVHQYQKMDIAVLENIAQSKWKSLVLFCRELGVDIKVVEKF
jgi:uncharacterized protein YutE (UPF0331/DUF86 family)